MSRLLAVAAFLLFVIANSAFAQGWPPTTTTILVGFGPGSGLDLLARVIAQALAERTGANFIVENRAGGGGNIAVAALAKATPDGSTIGMATFTPLVVSPWMVKTSYDPLSDIAPVTQLAETPSVLLVNKKLRIGSLKEFLALIEKNPDKYSYSTPGLGTVSHISMEIAAGAVGSKMTHVPFRSTPEQIQSLLTGDVDAATVQIGFVADMIASGQVVPLALTAEERWPSMPDIPTTAEAGLPSMPTTQWIGVFAPRNTPHNIVDRISREINEILARPDIRDRMAKLFYKPVGSSPDELSARLKSDHQLWHSILGKLGLLAR